jgi:hypothetical protein
VRAIFLYTGPLIRSAVYRAVAKVTAGAIIGTQAGVSNGTAGIDQVDEDWAGQVFVETEGTTERGCWIAFQNSSDQVPCGLQTRKHSKASAAPVRPTSGETGARHCTLSGSSAIGSWGTPRRI